ncbi:hypothetical protein QEH42_gp287 [Microbacterium phage Pumpernickel]|uniref:Uncharacterized protein n=1 Tax=Microbacterium phage Pumpernickel TaxID=2885983 RepID=A0AAE9C2X5_9CAUD|nr:hypothetical protein QEH42_gp287 [Microbacterium phage Pumpernickel]UDL15931.1 hypothetical protein SEA_PUMPERNICKEL_181 [Microbacterium phage Pumpernickel]
MYEYNDDTLLYTLQHNDVPRILTDRKDGTVVYVALNETGDGLIEVAPEEVDND